MKKCLALYLVLLTMVACSKVQAPAELKADVFSKGQNAASRYLAYEHSIELDTDEEKVSELFNKAIANCHEASESLCTVLQSNFNSGRSAHASLKFRAKPHGIQKLISSLRQQGQVTDQSTTAEDLAAPIEDSSKKLAMMQDYRSKLETLRTRAANDVDALIKVNRELAQVQSEIEAAEGNKAHLLQRVETEILNVRISSKEKRSFWTPVGYALSGFKADFSQGIASVITASAYMIPWLALFVFLFWTARKLWRRRNSVKT
jgi:superfamily I DNA/RNA helicase